MLPIRNVMSPATDSVTRRATDRLQYRFAVSQVLVRV